MIATSVVIHVVVVHETDHLEANDEFTRKGRTYIHSTIIMTHLIH